MLTYNSKVTQGYKSAALRDANYEREEGWPDESACCLTYGVVLEWARYRADFPRQIADIDSCKVDQWGLSPFAPSTIFLEHLVLFCDELLS